MNLLIIDPQNSFCQQVPVEKRAIVHSGELYIDGASQDMTKLAFFLRHSEAKINKIVVTLDTHQLMHISHNTWYSADNHSHPEPFSVIELKDDKIICKEREYDTPNNAQTKKYLKELKKLNKIHIVWPPHCLLGTQGHNITSELMESLLSWESNKRKAVVYIQKGIDQYCEHYSAVKPEVSSEYDNTALFSDLFSNNEPILVAGEARSHCVAATMKDLIKFIDPKRFVLLNDAMSNVSGFEQLGEKFLEEMQAMGVQIKICDNGASQ